VLFSNVEDICKKAKVYLDVRK